MKNNRPTWADRLIAISTGLILLTYIGVNYVSCQQLDVMKRQLNEMEKSSTQVNVTDQKRLRAYVYAHPGHVYNVQKDTSLQSHTTVGNSGNTFAKKVIFYAGIKVMKPPGIDIKGDISSKMVKEPGERVISPGIMLHTIIKTKTPPAITEEEVQAIFKREKRIYVFGKVVYDDEFGQRHNTEYCHVYYGGDGRITFNGIWGYHAPYAKYCENHNYAD